MNNKKTIAVIVPELLPVPPVKGGAVEHWVHEAMGRVDQSQYDITMVSRPSGVYAESGIRYLGIPWTAIEQYFFRLKEKVTWKNPLRYLAKIQNVFSYGRRVAAQIQGVDILYIHNEPNLLLFLKPRAGQKVILHMHNEHLCSRAFRPLYRRALQKVDRVICVSDYIRRSALQHYPEFKNKFQVIINATDPQEFRPFGDEAKAKLTDVIQFDDQCQYILYVGRLNPVKGVHVLIDAFKQVYAALPHARLIITGSSFFGGAAKTGYEHELVNLSQSINHAIIFTGFLPHEKLKYLYSAVDVISVPSVWQDPCPLVVLEGMASGKCVVGSAVGGVPEVIEHNVDGILVPPGNVQVLADSLIRVLQDPSVNHALGGQARQKILASFAWERLVKQIEQEFESV